MTEQSTSPEQPSVAPEVDNKQIEDLRQQLTAAEEKIKENWELYLRSRADLENTRKRAQLDVEHAHKYGVERFAKELMAVLDSMEQGLMHIKDPTHPELAIMRQGMELTQKLFIDVLNKFGITEIVPQPGSVFDANLHEVISMQEDNNAMANTILAVMQKGFVLQNRVLRPARVVVARNSA